MTKGYSFTSRKRFSDILTGITKCREGQREEEKIRTENFARRLSIDSYDRRIKH